MGLAQASQGTLTVNYSVLKLIYRYRALGLPWHWIKSSNGEKQPKGSAVITGPSTSAKRICLNKLAIDQKISLFYFLQTNELAMMVLLRPS